MNGFSGAGRHWRLEPDVAHLNHGGFGAAPVGVLEEQRRWREEIERNPTDFFARRVSALLAEARAELAAFLATDPHGMVFVPNATTGVATVLASLVERRRLRAGDEVLTTDHCYNAVRVQLDVVAARSGARVVVARVPVDVESAGDVVDAVFAAATGRTKVLVVDHVASPTGLVFPVGQLVAECRRRGIVSVVDGAHAPGMLPVAVDELDPDYWTGNLHKWVCAPKGAAVLWARAEHRSALRPLVPSRLYYEGLHPAFDWTGTDDPSAVLSAPAAVSFFDKLGWDDVRRHNHTLAAEGAGLVADVLGTAPPLPDALAGAMRVVPLGRTLPADVARAAERRLHDEYGVEAPLTGLGDDATWVRLSAQVYNTLDDYARLAAALPRVLASTP